MDLTIIGAGPAGLTAAIYARRAGLTVTVLDQAYYGGQMAATPEVENYPAIEKISGYDLAEKMFQQATGLGAEFVFEQVQSINWNEKIIFTEERELKTKALIIANGAKRRKLACEGEETFAGKGVSYCATCDGSFFKGKHAAVVGGGNTALEDAIYLANICEKVYLVHRRDAFRGESHLAKQLMAKKNIEILYDSVVENIYGSKVVEGFTVRNVKTSKCQGVPVSAVFVAIGLMPDNHLIEHIVALDPQGYIVAKEDCKTTVSGIFAAGDTRTTPLRQIVTAAADGAVAAVQAAKYIEELQ